LRAWGGTFLGAAIALAALGSGEAHAGGRAVVLGDGVRIQKDGRGLDRALETNRALWKPGAPIRVAALQDEAVAIQILVQADGEGLSGVTVDLPQLAPPGGAQGPSTVRIERFVEHYVTLAARSRNDHRPLESLGWAPAARPADEAMLGALPDALVPVDHAPPWCPYPMNVGPSEVGAIWIDLAVPAGTPPGRHTGDVVVKSASGEIGRMPLELEIGRAALPYRAVSFLAFYAPANLAERIGALEPAERQLFQLLHAHHVDALGSIRNEEDLARLHPALDGSLFTRAHGYEGPGEGVAPAAVALGAYGTLGDPSPSTVARLEGLVPRIPTAVDDVFLYAIDEQCRNPRGPHWRRLLSSSTTRERVQVAHSCHEDPRGQDVDLVLMPSQSFDEAAAVATRKMGRDVWVYNGMLPRSGPLLLDAPLASLCANAWISATRSVGRWFLWETTFWNDDNRGGRGPVDPYLVAESFHNAGGDSALGDGLLVYPGTQTGRFAEHSANFTGVFPSMRLKSLRRGIQDAGYLALARDAHPAEADAVVARLLPASLDEVDINTATPWPTDGAAYAEAREALRRLVPDGASLEVRRVAATLDAGRANRRLERRETWLTPTNLVITLCIGALGLGVVLGIRSYRGRRVRGRRAV
jgi:hypothetical protein